MPCAGEPVASMMTSSSGAAIIANASFVTCVCPVACASLNDDALSVAASQPTFTNAAFARSGERSATATK